MSKKIFMLFLMLVLISVSAVSAAEWDDNNDTIVSSADVAALSVANDVDAIDDSNGDVAGGDDNALSNDAKSSAGGNNEIYGATCGNSSSQLLAASEDNNVLGNDENDLLSVNKDNGNILGDKTDYDILVEEINAQKAGGNIYLNHGNYTYTDFASSNSIVIDVDCTLDGNGATIDVSGAGFPVFKIKTQSFTIKNVIIKNAGNGVIYCNETTNVNRCTIDNVRFVNNSASMGGAIYYWSPSELTVKNCYFENSGATNSGGAIYTGRSLLNVTNCTFVGNHATDGGAIHFTGNSPSSVKNCVFVNNSAGSAGGAIWLKLSSPDYNFTVENCSFSDNHGYNGGAIHLGDAACNIKNCSFVGNHANQGGAFFAIYSDYDYNIEYCSFVNNTASYSGRAIWSRIIPIVNNNWWGSNNPDWGALIDADNYFVPSSYVVLNGTADTQNTTKGSKVKLSYAFYKSGTSEVLSGMCRPIELSTTRGNLDNYSGYLVDGVFSTEFRSYWLGENEITAIVDNQEIKINIYVNPTIWYVNTTVASSGDGKSAESAFKTLQEALDAAIDDDTIMIASGTYAGTNNTGIGIYKNLNFEKYGDDEVIFDACGNGRIWHVSTGKIHINGLTFKNGKYNGEGGALYFSGVLSTSFINATFVNNTAKYGGAVYFYNNVNDVTIMGDFTGNSAELGGAIYFFEYVSFVTISGDFINNTGQNLVYAGNNGYENIIRDSIIINNNVDKIVDSEGCRINFTDTWFGNNATNYNETPANVGIDLGNWLFLNATADSDELEINRSSTIVFKLQSYDGSTVSDYNASKMNIVLDLTKTLGELNQSTALIGEEIIYTAKQVGDAGITGTFKTTSYTVELTNINPKTHTTIDIANYTVALNVKDEVTTGATLTPADAGNLTYTSSNETVVRVVDGKILAVGEGSANITVSFAGNRNYTAAENKTITVTVTLNDASVSVNNDTLDLFIDGNFTIVATTSPKGLNVTYVIDNPDVISVDANGVVTALKEGNTTVIVKVGGDGVYVENSTAVTVTVSKVPTQIIVARDTLDLNILDNFTAGATLTPADAGNLTYTSSNSSVAIVEDGYIKALVEGTAIITVSFAGDEKYETAENKTINITVTKIQTEIILTNQSVDLKSYQSIGDLATLNPAKAGNLIFASSNVNVATVDDKGMIMARDKGTAIITVSYEGNEIYTSAESNITVNVSPNDASVSVESRTVNLKFGEDYNIIATTDPIGLSIEYESSNVSVAYVTSTGIIKAGVEGTAIITLSVGNGRTIAYNSTTINVTVGRKDASISVENRTVDLFVGDNFTIVANTAPPGLDVTYVPDNSGVVSIDDNGVVTTLKEGKATIIVKIVGNGIYFENSTTVAVTVSKIPTNITLASDAFDLTVLNSTSAGATLTPADAGNLTYTSSNESVVIVENGTIKAVGEGNAIITVSFAGDDKYAAAENKTINVAVSLMDVIIKVNNSTVDLKVDENFTIVATTVPAGLNVNYVIDNSDVVSVDDNGVVTALKNGTASIIVKVGGDGVYAENSTTVTVTVSKVPTNISVVTDTLVLKVHQNVTAGAALTPDDAGNLTYASSNESVVKVENGIIKAIGEGTAIITVSFAGDDRYAAAENKTIGVTVILNASVSVNNSTLDLFVGDNFTVVATTVPEGLAVSFTSSNESVATVDAEGKIVAVGIGSAIITVSVGGEGIYTLNSTTVSVNIVKKDLNISAHTFTMSGNVTLIIVGFENATGNVTVTVGENNYSSSIMMGMAFVSIPKSDENVTAYIYYPGDDKYRNASTSIVIVAKKDLNITVTADPICIGQNATIIVTGLENATGNVTVIAGKSLSNATIINGTATAIISGLNKTTRVIVFYMGDNTYSMAFASVNITVRENLTISASADPISVGENATVVITGLKNATGNVSVRAGDKIYFAAIVNGTAKVVIPGLTESIIGYVDYEGDENYTASNTTVQITVNKINTKISANAITATYNVNKNLVITLKDDKGNAISGVSIAVDLNGIKTYTTNNKGQITINVAKLVPKAYTAKITFAGNNNYAASSANVKVTVKKAKSTITAKKKTFKKAKKTKKYSITLKSGKTAIKKVQVTLKIKGKKIIKAKTNNKGKATFKIKKLTKKGTFKVTIKFKGNKYYTAVTKKVKIKIK